MDVIPRSFRVHPVVFGLAGLVATALAGCQSYKSPSGLATVPVQIGNTSYTVEIANTDPRRETGLMYRDTMPAHWGMIFVFPDSAPRTFWMKNTRIPLDIVYLDDKGRVVSVQTMKPHDETPIPSGGDAKYAVELNAGQAAACGVHQGDTLTIPAQARDATN